MRETLLWLAEEWKALWVNVIRYRHYTGLRSRKKTLSSLYANKIENLQYRNNETVTAHRAVPNFSAKPTFIAFTTMKHGAVSVKHTTKRVLH
jgi:hypothetical protein